MASLITRINELILAVGTDYKQLRTWITGSSTGDLTALNTTDKSSLINAINEARTTGGSGTPADATETIKGVVELATLTEMAVGTDPNRVATVAGVRQERTALKNEILGGVGPMADTLQELYTLAQSAEETSAINALVTEVGLKANTADVYLKTDIGNPDTDLVALYNAAKA